LTVTSKAYATAVDHLDIDATVEMISPGAGSAGRITLGGGADAPLSAGGPYCTAANCACPQESPAAGTHFEKMASGEQWLGLTGGPKAGSVTLLGQSLPDFCKKPAKSCLVGQWTGVNFDVHVANIVEQGGAGVRLHIDGQGNTTAVFDGMKPVTFRYTTDSTTLSGQFTYAGRITGKLVLPPSGVASGNWLQASPANIGNLTATVHVASPVDVAVGPINMAELAGDLSGAGGAVSAKPLLTGGWQCSGDTLVTTPPANSAVTGSWTLTRTGPG
jgi:hypothetical protein